MTHHLKSQHLERMQQVLYVLIENSEMHIDFKVFQGFSLDKISNVGSMGHGVEGAKLNTVTSALTPTL